jgi:hypothetical protein
MGRLPINKLITKSMMKIMNRIFAIPMAAPAIPPKPNMAAMIAITKKTQAYQSIVVVPRL